MSANGPQSFTSAMQLTLVALATVHFINEPAPQKKLTPFFEQQVRQQALARNQHNPSNQKPAHFAKSDTPANRFKR